MVNGDVGDLSVFADEVCRLTVKVHDWQALLPLEHVKPPPLFGFPGLGGLAVLDHHAIEDVGVAHQGPRQAHLNLKVHIERTHLIELPYSRLFIIIVGELFLPVHFAKWSFRPGERLLFALQSRLEI